ncbi:MAG: UvrB/UvrC motif-containing protein [Peptococcia bacterium]
MNCQKCQQRPASIHIAQIVNGEKHETYLCEVCAQAEKITVEIPQLPIDNLKNLLGFLGQSYLTEQGSYQSVCKNCQTSYKKIYETGYVGCSECYDQFSSQLENVVQKIHGMQKHRGKIPNRLGASFRVKRDLEDLRLQLRQAVEREEYEKAAELRDKIKLLEEQQSLGQV